MSDNVSVMPGVHVPTNKPNQALVQSIEALLEKAKSGQLQSFVGAGWTSDGLRATLWVDLHNDVYQMLGSLAWLEHEYVQRHT